MRRSAPPNLWTSKRGPANQQRAREERSKNWTPSTAEEPIHNSKSNFTQTTLAHAHKKVRLGGRHPTSPLAPEIVLKVAERKESQGQKRTESKENLEEIDHPAPSCQGTLGISAGAGIVQGKKGTTQTEPETRS